MGGFTNFAISFTIISILTGAVILFDYGLAWAGTAAALSAGRSSRSSCCSSRPRCGDRLRLPDAGGLYYWASRMEQELGLVDGLVQPNRPVRNRRGNRLLGLAFLNDTIVTPLLEARCRLQEHDYNPFQGTVPILTGATFTMGVLMLIRLAINVAASMSSPSSTRSASGGTSSSWPRSSCSSSWRETGQSGSQPLRHPATRHGGVVEQQPDAAGHTINIVRTGDQVSDLPGLHVLPAAG